MTLVDLIWNAARLIRETTHKTLAPKRWKSNTSSWK